MHLDEGQLVIYDIGANTGDDLPYYMKKADKVVAVEANPRLATIIESRFRPEIDAGVLVVESVAVTEDENDAPIGFWIHTENHVLSTARPPQTQDLNQYDYFEVKGKTLQALFDMHGFPSFVKLDIEGLDANVLRGLLIHSPAPPYISAEGHDPAILGLLSGLGGYTRFKIVEGKSVSRQFRNFSFRASNGNTAVYSFPAHSAGPFGEDIPGPWLNASDMFQILRVRGLGWYDIHASMGEEPPPMLQKLPLKGWVRAFLETNHPILLEKYWRITEKMHQVTHAFRR